MEVLKWTGYTIAALFVLAVILGGGLLLVAIGLLVGIIFRGAMLVGFLAFLIKEGMEPSPDHKETRR